MYMHMYVHKSCVCISEQAEKSGQTSVMFVRAIIKRHRRSMNLYVLRHPGSVTEEVRTLLRQPAN